MINIVTRLQRALVALLPLLVIACFPAATACSAAPARGPAAVRIDPAFTAKQRQAIYDAVDAWDEAAGLTVAVSSWDDSSAIPILRDDSIVAGRLLGSTRTNTRDRGSDRIRLAGAGCFTGSAGWCVSDFDFQTTAMHELGHLFGLDAAHDAGCDGRGHSASPGALMFAHGTPDGKRHEITSEDVERVQAVIERAW